MRILIRVLKGEIGEKKKKKLKLNAKKFYYDETKTLEEKLDLAMQMNKELEMSGQKSMPVVDMEARWKNKKKGSSLSATACC